MKRPASTLLLAVGLGALLSSTVLAQDATEPGPSDLEVALSYAPEGTTIAGFTDWGAIKQARGLEILTSDVPEDMRINALGTIAREEALFASFGASSFRDHATRWGWDTTDLDWNADFSGAGAPVAVLHFRDDLDLAPFMELLDERAYATRLHGSAIVRSHDLDVTTEWFSGMDIPLLNIAIFPDDDRTIIVGGSDEAMEAAIEAFDAGVSPLLASEVIADLLVDVGTPLGAVLEVGAGVCEAYASAGGLSVDLQPWQAMLLTTYPGPAGDGLGQVRMAFPGADATSLEADLAARVSVAGTFLRQELVSSSAGDETLTFELAPGERGNHAFLRAVFTRDLPLASCAVTASDS